MQRLGYIIKKHGNKSTEARTDPIIPAGADTRPLETTGRFYDRDPL